MLERIAVYDLDGVLVDTSHRYRNLPDGRIDLEYWLKNNTPENVAKDKLLPMVEQYQRHLHDAKTYLVICTARVAQWFDHEFIRNRIGWPNKFICRKLGDKRHDATLKRNQLRKLLTLRQFHNLPVTFWDDNIKNVEAIAELGVDARLVKSKICET